MSKIVNMTPHDINIVGELNLTIPSSGVARMEEKTEIVGNINGIPIIKKSFGDVQGLPAQTPGTYFIVSLLVAQVARRVDVFAIGETVRNDKGQVIGAKSLAVV